MSTQPVKNVVLVHGGFVDGSGWQRVHRLPKPPAATRSMSPGRTPRPT